ncbi:hypothetical protein SAMN03159423_3355 [Bradyrhizobium sp. NFR13]|jgi:hypothetical protein|uniref:hypothetical protein n=1 Tax=Bradyrhizobium sp. NFR13 TaxID=1566285 RepID=UPI0008E88200|nr:hypothetical protein [Bradyrhizobium sp. NFR13]SFL74052.1 hypothetical protein SAMN03159423_3355 [Bradyrhizobium sp. NFR13]
MSKVSSLVLGMVAGATMFGAIQYASGNDLRGTLTDSNKVASSDVNRAAKGDRASLITTQNEQSQTLSFRVQGLSDTSILLRMGVAPVVAPTKNEAVNIRPLPMNAKPQRAAVGCEPPVSVLSEMAKMLQPGRCVT